MFIELTDILRCPVSHEEQYLVLVPGEMAHRMVRTGRLGCPVCHREYLIIDGEAVFAPETEARPVASDSALAVDPSALAAFLGLSGPGGYIALVGDIVRLGAALIDEVPGVHLVGLNPPPGTVELPMMSLARAASIPIRSRSLRGVILGGGYAEDPAWQTEAARSVLPGLRVVGQGAQPFNASLHVLATAANWWVAERV